MRISGKFAEMISRLPFSTFASSNSMLLCPPSTQTSPTRILSSTSVLLCALDRHLLRVGVARATAGSVTFHAGLSPALADACFAGER